MRTVGVDLQRGRIVGDELERAPVRVVLPEEADQIVVAKAAEVELQDVGELMRDDRRAFEHRAGMNDDRLGAEGEPALVLG